MDVCRRRNRTTHSGAIRRRDDHTEFRYVSCASKERGAWRDNFFADRGVLRLMKVRHEGARGCAISVICSPFFIW